MPVPAGSAPQGGTAHVLVAGRVQSGASIQPCTPHMGMRLAQGVQAFMDRLCSAGRCLAAG